MNLFNYISAWDRHFNIMRAFSFLMKYGRWLVLCAALLCLSVILLLVLVQTETGRLLLAQSIEYGLGKGSECRITIGDITGNILLAFHVDRIEVSDKKGGWLSVENSYISWDPFSLLKKKIHIREISAGSIVFKRMPCSPAQNDVKVSYYPEWPLNIPPVLIENLVLERLYIPQETNDSPSLFALRSKMISTDPVTGLEGSLSIDSLEDPDTSAKITWAITGMEPILALDAAVREPEGGIISSFIGLSEAGPLSLLLKGKGPIRKWEGLLSAKIDKLGETVTTVGIKDLKVISARGSGRINIDPSLAAGALPAVITGREISFVTDMECSLEKGGSLIINSLDLQAAGSSLSFDGSLNISQSLLEGDLILETDETGFLSETTGTGITGIINLESNLKMDLKSLTVRTQTIGTINRLENLPDYLSPVVRAGVSFSSRADIYEGNSLIFTGFSVRSGKTEISGDCSVDLSNRYLNAKTHVHLPDLTILSKALGTELKGSVESDLEIKGPLRDPEIIAEAAGKNIELHGLRLNAPVLRLHADGLFVKPRGGFKIGVLYNGQAVDMAVDFVLDGRTLSLGNISVSGPGSQITGVMDLDFGRNNAQGYLEAVSPDLASTPFPDNIPAFISPFVTGGLSLASQIEIDNWSNLIFTDLNIKTPNAELSGECTFDLDKKGLNAKTRILLPDLSVLAGPLNSRLEGALKLDLDINGPYNDPEIIALAEGKDIRLRDIPLKDPELSLRARDIFSRPDGSLEIEVSLKGYTVKAHTGFTLDRQFLTLNNLSLYGDDLTIKGELELDVNTAMIQGRLFGRSDNLASFTSITGKKIQGSASLETVLTGGIDGQQVDITLQGSSLSDSFINAEEISLNGSFKDYRLSNYGTRAAGLPVNSAQHGQVEGDLKVHIKGIQSSDPGFQNLPKANVWANASIENSVLLTDISIEGVSESPVRVSLNLPVSVSLMPPTFTVSREKTIQGQISGRLEIDRIPFLQTDDSIIKGSVLVDLDISGLPEKPDAVGTLQLIDGSYENITKGIIIKNASLLTSLSGNRLFIEEAHAGDGENGNMEARGWVDLLPLKNFPFSIETDINDFAFIRLDNMRINTGGRVLAAGTVSETMLSGDLKIERGEFLIPDRLVSGIRELTVIEINKPFQDEIAASKATARPAGKTGLDFSIEFPGKVFIRGRGLDSEWQGMLDVKGTAVNPLITGSMYALRGSFNFLGKPFQLRSGSLSFTGRNPPAPIFDVHCENTGPDMTVILHAYGPVSGPKFTIESIPAMPYDEILSRLIFGRDMGNLTPFQGLRLAYALNTLRGGGSGILNLLDRTRKILGVDQLEFRQSPENSGETSVSIGKYIREDVYIEMDRGFGDDRGSISVEVEVTPNISVESGIGADSQGGLGVNWKLDY